MDENDNNFNLPDDIFGNRKSAPEEKKPERKDDFEINFIKLFQKLLAAVKVYVKHLEQQAGILISFAVHVLLIFIIGSTVVFTPPKERTYISVEVIKLELKEIEEIPPEPKPPEKSEDPTEVNSFTEEAVSEIDTNVKIDDANDVDVEDITIAVDMPNMLSALPGDSALKFPAFFSSRTPSKRRKALKKHGGSDETEASVEKALAYLDSKQNEDGSWGSENLRDGSNVVLSSLAVLTFLAHGETTFSPKYGQTVRKGIRKLVDFSRMENIEKCADGFGHAILAYALSEAYGITLIPAAKKAMDKRIKAIVNGQNKFGSFNANYDNSPQNAVKDAGTGKLKREIIPGEPKCDLSFAGWNCQAMMAATISGSEVEGLQEALTKAEEGITTVHQAKDGGFSYGFNACRFEAVPEVSPVGSLCLQLLGAGEKPAAKKALKWIKKNKRGTLLQCRWKGNQHFPLYAWYYQTQTLFQGHKGKGQVWKKWNESMKKALLDNQQYNGSWLSPTLGSRKGFGENLSLFKNEDDLAIYCTSFCALMLQVYYRYLPTFVPVENAKKQVSLIDINEDLGLKITSDFNIKTDDEILSAKTKYISEFDAVEFGVFNCIPSTPEDEHVEEEFAVYDSDENTIRVNKKEDFPQVLKPNQRVAIYLDDFVPENFRNHIELKISIASGLDGEKESKLHILINSKDVWKARVNSKNTFITALIPKISLDAGSNILQIRNSGDLNISFDWLKLDEFSTGNSVRLAIEDLDKMPPERRKYFKTGIINFSCVSNEIADNFSTFFIPDSEYALETERQSLLRRRMNLDKLKERFEIVANANPEYEKNLVRLYKRLERHLKIGIEPVVKIEGENQILLEAAVAACGNFVYFWALPEENKNLKGTIERHSPVADILDSNLCNVRLYDEHKEPMPYLGDKINIKYPNDIWGMWSAKDTANRGLSFQKKYLSREPNFITEWLSKGGDNIILKDVIKGGKFFDELTGNEKLSWEGLKRTSPLFEGTPVKVACNILPVSQNRFLNGAYCVAVQNTEDIITIQASAKWPNAEEVEIMCPIPWDGKTTVKTTQGFVETNSPFKDVETLKTEEKTMEVKNGVFKTKMHLPSLVTIRLAKANAQKPLKMVDLLTKEKHKENKFRKNELEITSKRPATGLIRTRIRWPNGMISPEGQNYTGQEIPATKGKIAGALNVVPWDAKSNLIEICYPKGKPDGNEGIRFYFGGGPNDADLLSFWIYPRLDKKARRKITSLRFYFNGKFFEADLKTDAWQRVVVPLTKKVRPPYWGNICFLADSKRHEFRKGRSASFELNGFAVWGKNHKKNGSSGLKNSRIETGRDSLSFTFLGKPESYSEYRYYFKDPVEFKDYIALVNGKSEIVFRAKGWNALKGGIMAFRIIKKELERTQFMMSRFLPHLNDEDIFKPLLSVIIPFTKLPVSKIGLNYNPHAQCLELRFKFPKEAESYKFILKTLARKEKSLLRKKRLVPLMLKLNFSKIIPERKKKSSRKK